MSKVQVREEKDCQVDFDGYTIEEIMSQMQAFKDMYGSKYNRLVIEEHNGYYNEKYNVLIGYRDESEAESKKRLKDIELRKATLEEKERQQYDKLKKKYGDKE